MTDIGKVTNWELIELQRKEIAALKAEVERLKCAVDHARIERMDAMQRKEQK